MKSEDQTKIPIDTILDTGTTFVYFESSLYNLFLLNFEGFCALTPSNCAGLDTINDCFTYLPDQFQNYGEFFNTFPLMTFYLNGEVPYIWYPEDYLDNIQNSSTFCIGIQKLGSTILGGIFMRNYDFTFDKTNKRISFARANCSQTADSFPFISSGEIKRRAKN